MPFPPKHGQKSSIRWQDLGEKEVMAGSVVTRHQRDEVTMSQSVKKILIGQPIPISKLRMAQRYAWLEILEAIEPGMAQAVKLSYGGVRDAISKLVESGTIREGEYTVTTRPDSQKKGERIVYILRTAKPSKETAG